MVSTDGKLRNVVQWVATIAVWWRHGQEVSSHRTPRWSKGDSNSPSQPEHQHSEGHREFMTLNGLRPPTLNVFVGVAATSGSRPAGARVHAAAPGVLSPNRPGHYREDAEIGLCPTVAPGWS